MLSKTLATWEALNPIQNTLNQPLTCQHIALMPSLNQLMQLPSPRNLHHLVRTPALSSNRTKTQTHPRNHRKAKSFEGMQTMVNSTIKCTINIPRPPLSGLPTSNAESISFNVSTTLPRCSFWHFCDGVMIQGVRDSPSHDANQRSVPVLELACPISSIPHLKSSHAQTHDCPVPNSQCDQ